MRCATEETTTMETLLEKSPTLTTEQAHAIAVDAYVYFYPLVLTDCLAQAIHKR